MTREIAELSKSKVYDYIPIGRNKKNYSNRIVGSVSIRKVRNKNAFTLTTSNYSQSDYAEYPSGGRYNYKESRVPGNRDKYQWSDRAMKWAVRKGTE